MERWVELDRYAVAMTREMQDAVMHDYGRYEFHFAMQKLHAFCSEFLGAFYLDILKDRLYTCGVASPARRAAQSALWHITHSLLRLLAPVLSFTAEEAWGFFTRRAPNDPSADSVFFHTVHTLPTVSDAKALLERWALVREARAEVQKELESLRAKGSIGSALAAEVEIHAAGAALPRAGGVGRRLALCADYVARYGEGGGRAGAAEDHRATER